MLALGFSGLGLAWPQALGRYFFEHFPNINNLTSDRRGGDHGRAHEQRAAGGAAHPAFEIPV